MLNNRLRGIAIVGGGTAGWMAASMLARALPSYSGAISVIESPDIGTIGVGEATIPPMIDLLRFLDINEADFVRHTFSTYKLGIRFSDWRQIGHTYWHPFGTFGARINRRPFYHSWHKAQADGLNLNFNDYSACAALAQAGKFTFPDLTGQTDAAGLRYALHFDAGLVARYLRAYSERLGVQRLERTVSGATRLQNGNLDELVFADGSRLRADLFIDCSGFRGVLIEQVLQTGYLPWTDVLPCDRAVAVPTEITSGRPPYTQSFARSAGWRWRIPLQHRAGNGYVYSSAFTSDSQAVDDLLSQVGAKTLADPRQLRFVTGRRKLLWNHNCVALGLASGFLEPLESTSIHLVQMGIAHLLTYFPAAGFDAADRDQYNRTIQQEYEWIRDFIILHFKATERDDTPFWNHCREMKVPDSLQERMDLFRAHGRVLRMGDELFAKPSWVQVMHGQRVHPRSYHPLADLIPEPEIQKYIEEVENVIANCVKLMPTHNQFVSQFCAAEPVTKVAA
jgi:tryptophan 7-halogenase